jgi:hypothetical protein
MHLGIGEAVNTGAIPIGSGEMSSILGADFRPRRTHEIMEYDVEEELSLYDPRTEVVHILNSTAAVIWRMCDGSRRVEEISGQMADVYGLDPAVTEGDVREVISKFLQAGLLC